MAFDSGSISFKRFFVSGQRPRQVDEALLEQLATKAIGADSIQTADHSEIGWATGEHILDTEFGFAKNVVADGLYFALRIDTNKPPTELVRSYQKINEQAMLQATGREFLSKAQRREAKEQALARLDSEAKSGAFKRMKQIPVFWDLPRNELYFGSAGNAAAESLMLLFRETFDRGIVAASAGEIAARWAAASGESRLFEDCRPAHFVTPPEGAGEASAGHGDEGRTNDFLGTEWLTWLWYATQVESPTITTARSGAVTVLFEKLVQMRCAFRLSGTVAVSSDSPTRLPEALVALSGGKLPVRTAMQIEAQGNTFSFAVRGDAMVFSGVQLPPPEDANSARAVFEDRIAKLRDLIDAGDGLYTVFLKRRLSSKWPQTLSAMRAWIASCRHAALPQELQATGMLGAVS
ncbi:MAG: hypothetical protein ACUVXJ_05680 [Phycisphaerae bacterium]